MNAHDLLLLLAGGQSAVLTLWGLVTVDTRRHRRQAAATATAARQKDRPAPIRAVHHQDPKEHHMPEPNPAPVEYLYEIHDPNWDDTFTGWAIRRHQITKKTPKRIFYTDRWGRTHSIDRQQIEADGHIWDRVHSRRLYLNEPEMPQHPAPLDLADLKQAMADAHPDRGGTDAAFIAARTRYERAKLAHHQTAMTITAEGRAS